MHQSHCPKWLLSFHFDLKALTPYRKYSEAIRSTGYKKTLRSPMERLFKIPLFKDRSWTPAQLYLQIKPWARGGLTVLKGKVGAAKHTQSLRIHLVPISSSICCDTHKKNEGEVTLQPLPVLLASSGRSGPPHLHNCPCMTLILPGFKVGNVPPLWTRIWHFFSTQNNSSCFTHKSHRKWSFYCEILFNLSYSSTHNTSDTLFYVICMIQSCSLRCLFAFYWLCCRGEWFWLLQSYSVIVPCRPECDHT